MVLGLLTEIKILTAKTTTAARTIKRAKDRSNLNQTTI